MVRTTGAPSSLEEVLAETWASLRRGVEDRRSPLHTPTLATQSNDGPAARTVVLRAVDESARTVTCHTDGRSGKVAQLSADPRVAWLFYDREHKRQLRLTGVGVVRRDGARVEECWRGSRPFSRRAYCTVSAPGTMIARAGSGLVPGLEERVPGSEESDRLGKPHFAIIDAVIDHVDWLWLAARGHRRARFDWNGKGWDASWVVP